MGQSVNEWLREKVREYGIVDVQSFMDNYKKISLDLYIAYGDPDGYNLNICDERESNLVKRIAEIAGWTGLADRKGQLYLFAPQRLNADHEFMDAVRVRTNSRGAEDIARLALAVERNDWDWVVGRIWSYRRSAESDRQRLKNKVMVDDLPALTKSEGGDRSGDDEDIVDVAERFVHRDKYYDFCRDQLAVVDDRLDAEKLYFRHRTLFAEHDLDRDNAVKLIGYALGLAAEKRCQIEDILDDTKFREFLRRFEFSLM